MKKCLRIAIGVENPDILINEIQKKGAKLGVEGTIQFVAGDKELRIIACGLKDQVDQLVDQIHKDVLQAGLNNINIEPFIKAKDYRGVFRIIE